MRSGEHDTSSGYRTLALAVGLHFFVMYAVGYAMVDSWSDVFLNVNRGYMAAMMVAPMVVLMLLLMRSMFPDARRNRLVQAAAAAALLGAFLLGRAQVLVGDRQFLRSMIPHHSSAIVMCERSSVRDPEIVELCGQIVEAQEREIAQMKRILERL